jgi:hypothetical protein
MSKVIRKFSGEKEMEDLLSKLKTDDPCPEIPPMEPNQQVMDRMKILMDNHLSIQTKRQTLMEISRELARQERGIIKDLNVIMKLYGVEELIRGKHKFVIEQRTRTSHVVGATKRKDLLDILIMGLGDVGKATDLMSLIDSASKNTTQTKLCCVDFDEGTE